jgi:hypothetical protein
MAAERSHELLRALSQENSSHQFPWTADAIAKKTITLSDTPVCL